MAKSTAPCLDCKIDTLEINEFYMVQKGVWLEAVPDEDSTMTKFLCIECLERRLKRSLRASDFMPDVPLNSPELREMSERLANRLTAAG